MSIMILHVPFREIELEIIHSRPPCLGRYREINNERSEMCDKSGSAEADTICLHVEKHIARVKWPRMESTHLHLTRPSHEVCKAVSRSKVGDVGLAIPRHRRAHRAEIIVCRWKSVFRLASPSNNVIMNNVMFIHYRASPRHATLGVVFVWLVSLSPRPPKKHAIKSFCHRPRIRAL